MDPKIRKTPAIEEQAQTCEGSLWVSELGAAPDPIRSTTRAAMAMSVERAASPKRGFGGNGTVVNVESGLMERWRCAVRRSLHSGRAIPLLYSGGV